MEKISTRKNKRAIKTRDELLTGDLVIYPFLWGWEVDRGYETSFKMRPCLVLTTFGQAEDKTAILLPITTSPRLPHHARFEIPAAERAATDMAMDIPAEVALNDINVDCISTSGRFRQNVPVRQFSADFMRGVREAYMMQQTVERSRRVVRPPMEGVERVAQFASPLDKECEKENENLLTMP